LAEPVGQGEQSGGLFDEPGSGALPTAVGAGQLTKAGSLGGRNAIKLMPTSLAASEHPNGMELALGAAAVGFAALAAHEVKGTRGHGMGGGQGAKGAAQGPVIAPELLSEGGGFKAHQRLGVVVFGPSVSIYCIIDTDCKQKIQKSAKKFEGGPPGAIEPGKPGGAEALSGHRVKFTQKKRL